MLRQPPIQPFAGNA